MSDLSKIERMKLEKMFRMSDGYVMDFSNRTFNDFIFDVTNLEIYDDKYLETGDSKAKRLRVFWDKESNYIVGNLTLSMLEFWREEKLFNSREITNSEQLLYDDCEKIAKKIKEDSIVSEIEVIREVEDDRDFNLLANSIRDSIEKNLPEQGLDRLHTYVMKFVRQLCIKHAIEVSKVESLNAIFGKYVKFIVANQKIESVMAEKILKYSVNVLEAFNDIRNNKSFAHDNSILNYSESILIFNNITNSIKFIESIEEQLLKKNNDSKRDNLPF